MRAFDRDPIRGGHYGQRSCEPRLKAEHMAAPTKPCDVKILLANSEPSTHDRHRARQQARTNGLGHDCEGGTLQGTHPASTLSEIATVTRPALHTAHTHHTNYHTR